MIDLCKDARENGRSENSICVYGDNCQSSGKVFPDKCLLPWPTGVNEDCTFRLFSLLETVFDFSSPSCQGFATVLAEALSSLDLPVAMINLKDYDPDDCLVEEVGNYLIFPLVTTFNFN